MELGDLSVVSNATLRSQSQRVETLAGSTYRLHPVQVAGADSTVEGASYERKSGTFAVPARSVAVFIRHL
jgi:hypothetical protein